MMFNRFYLFECLHFVCRLPLVLNCLDFAMKMAIDPDVAMRTPIKVVQGQNLTNFSVCFNES